MVTGIVGAQSAASSPCMPGGRRVQRDASQLEGRWRAARPRSHPQLRLREGVPRELGGVGGRRGGRAASRVESRRPASAGAGHRWSAPGPPTPRPRPSGRPAPSHGNRGKRGRPTGPPARRARPRSARPRPTSTRHPHTLPRRTTGGRAAWEAHVCLKGTKLHFDRGCSNPASRTAKFQILIRETESHRWSRKGERQRRR